MCLANSIAFTWFSFPLIAALLMRVTISKPPIGVDRRLGRPYRDAAHLARIGGTVNGAPHRDSVAAQVDELRPAATGLGLAIPAEGFEDDAETQESSPSLTTERQSTVDSRPSGQVQDGPTLPDHSVVRACSPQKPLTPIPSPLRPPSPS